MASSKYKSRSVLQRGGGNITGPKEGGAVRGSGLGEWDPLRKGTTAAKSIAMTQASTYKVRSDGGEEGRCNWPGKRRWKSRTTRCKHSDSGEGRSKYEKGYGSASRQEAGRPPVQRKRETRTQDMRGDRVRRRPIRIVSM